MAGNGVRLSGAQHHKLRSMPDFKDFPQPAASRHAMHNFYSRHLPPSLKTGIEIKIKILQIIFDISTDMNICFYVASYQY